MTNRFTVKALLFILTALVLTGCSEKAGDTKSFKVGAALALTGPQADFGLKVKQGLDLSADAINKAAGYQKVQIKYEDTLSTPKDGLTAYNKLIEIDGTKFVFGSGSYFANAIGPVADSKDGLFFAVGTSLPRITEGRQHVLRYSYTVDISAKVVAEYAAKKYKSIAVLAVEEEYGRIASDIFKKIFEAPDRRISFHGTFRVTDSEVRTIVQKALQSSPDALFVPGYGPGMVAVLRQARELKPNMAILGDVALANSSIIKAAGQAAEDAVVPAMLLDGGIPLDAEAKTFLDSYVQRFSKNPDMWTTGAYEALRLLMTAIDSTDGSVDSVRRYIIEKQPHRSFAGPVAYTATGESLIPMTLFRIHNGGLTPLAENQ
jgi:branched-chain amino acid transport system substrate-binding protein